MINTKINFNGRDEVLKIIDDGGEMVKFLGIKSQILKILKISNENFRYPFNFNKLV